MTAKLLNLTNQDCQEASRRLIIHARREMQNHGILKIYGVPRGGIPVAYLASGSDGGASIIVEDPEEANLIVDDIVDSGRTRARFQKEFPSVPFLSLVEFIPQRQPGVWVVFPWERSDQDASADDIVIRLLQYIGEDPNRGGLLETPQRVLKAWKEWTSGYGQDPSSVMKCFQDGGENYDEMVIVKDLPFYSHCEHHLAPFFGTATIAYIPNKKVVGLSKLGRVLNMYARRLQVQERLTGQIADAIQSHLKPLGVGVLIRARHLCMESRGIATQGHHTVTSALRGKFLDDEKVRSEFLSIA